MTVAFVFSNPRHHVEMMAPVATELARRGVPCRGVSLTELRGFASPAQNGHAFEIVRAIPIHARRDPSLGASIGTGPEGKGRALRRAAQLVVWHGGLRARLRHLLGDATCVVVPNDAAFPYRELATWLHDRRLPFALLQEGIRFPLPGVADTSAYGRGGADVICCWGAASADYFRDRGAPDARLTVTGNPRFDGLEPAAWRARGRALLTRLGLARAPLLYLSNPIDDQGFCTTREKVALFERFATTAAPILRREGRALAVKLHPREDVAAFVAAAARTPARGQVHVVADAPLFEVLGAGHAAVVLASTVGLEALLFGLPLGVLEVPGAGFVFDYVQGGGALGLHEDQLAAGLEMLLTGGASGHEAYLGRHVAHRGDAAARVADAIEGIRRP